MNKPQLGEKWRHFKHTEENPKLYKIVCLAKDSDSLEELVIYQAQYGEGVVYVGSLVDFLSEVHKPELPYQGPRFIKIL